MLDPYIAKSLSCSKNNFESMQVGNGSQAKQFQKDEKYSVDTDETIREVGEE